MEPEVRYDDSPKCVFVTGMPKTGVFALARSIASEMQIPYVQLVKDRQFYAQLSKPHLPGSFEHSEMLSLCRVTIARAMEPLTRPAVIEGLAALPLAEDMLERGHGLVVVRPPSWDTYKRILCPTTAMDRESTVLEFEWDCLFTGFLQDLYDRFAAMAERLADLTHQRVVTYNYPEHIYLNRPKMLRVFGMVDEQFRSVPGGGFGE